MKKIALFLGLLSFQFGFTQSLPLNFETSASTANFINFNGGTATVIANPLSAGINTSDSVARIIRNGGDPWAGSKIVLAANLNFSVLTKITMKVYTTAPVGTIAKLKLEGSGPSVEVDAYTTSSSSWQTLEWIFAGTANNLNELVFMFNFGAIGNGTASSTFYFDDIEQVLGPPAPMPTTLPLNFENGVADTDFLNFSGAAASVIGNPQKIGINTSDSVCRIIRNGGDIWAGSRILLTAPLNLSTMWHISMKVFTNAPVGTRVKLQLENATTNSSIDVLTTVSGAWETLEYNFYGQPNTFDKLTFMFDFGKVGNGSATSTFLFDDVQQSIGPAIPAPVATSLPINFESGMVSSDFVNEFGATGTVVANPQKSGINTSNTVGHIIKSGGQPWARTKLILTSNMDFSTLSSISMKVYTNAPVGTLLKLKVESTSSGAANERDVFTTVSGGWATYTWDFAGDPPVYNVLTFIWSYGSIGDASPNATFLIDDIEQVLPAAPLPKASLPVNFEGAVSSDYFSNFDGGFTTVIANAQKSGLNTSDSVAQMVRNNGKVWAGSKLNLTNNIDFSTLGYIAIKVFTLAPVGTTIKLKLEGPGNAETEKDVVTTVSGAWENMIWNFTGQPASFNSLVFMFDFGAVGDSSASSIFLYDDITQTNSTGTFGVDEMVLDNSIYSYPNPAHNFVHFTANNKIETIAIYDMQGRQVLAERVQDNEARVNVSGLAAGVYVAKIATSKGEQKIKISID